MPEKAIQKLMVFIVNLFVKIRTYHEFYTIIKLKPWYRRFRNSL